jgi:hypothetical protein
MKKIRSGIAIAILGIALSVIPGVAQAQISYVAGSAIAGSPLWDTSQGLTTWKCTFAGWAGVPVMWECKLYYQSSGTLVGTKSGSFSGGSYSTPLYSATVNAVLCVQAFATYADGSSEDYDTVCH